VDPRVSRPALPRPFYLPVLVVLVVLADALLRWSIARSLHAEVQAVSPFHLPQSAQLLRPQPCCTPGHTPEASTPKPPLAALGGVSPLPASSGNAHRHRLNRGGDRRLNRAIYTVALTRLGHDPRTREYFARRTAEGRTRREIIRSLKRYISRKLFRTLTAAHLRPNTT
jgi:hypothetical protein